MAVAVQISGQVRTLKQSYFTLKEQILDRYDCEIFLSTWGKEEELGWVFDLLHPVDYSIIEQTDENMDSLGISGLAKKYNHTDISYNGTYLFVKHFNVLCGMFHRWKSDTLRQQSGREYDAVINTRTDLVYGEPLPEEAIEAAQKYILIPAGFDWDCGLNDIFSVGHPKATSALCSEFVHYEEYMNQGVTNHPEGLFKHHALAMKLPVRRFSYTLFLRNMQVS